MLILEKQIECPFSPPTHLTTIKRIGVCNVCKCLRVCASVRKRLQVCVSACKCA